MDRYNEVKLLLKNWEQDFVKQHKTKPNKEDIDQAPEETRQLYKEYSRLKQAKGKSSREAATSDPGSATSDHGPATSDPGPATVPADFKSTQKVLESKEESDFWGTHLNRKAMPISSPTLNCQERENLNASSQYYGLKLKNNLATLSKERPTSLKKSHISGRVPLNYLKDGQTISKNSPNSGAAAETSTTGQAPGLFSPGRMKACQRSLTSKPAPPEEPEDQFKPFQAETPDSVSSFSSNGYKSIDQDSSSHFSPTRLTSTTPSSLLSSLSPKSTFGTLNEVSGAKEKLNENTGSLRDQKENLVSLEHPDRSIDSGISAGFKGGPPLLKEGSVGRPSPARRLTLVDKKWLQRCQVFGELEAEEKPGAGNHDIKMDKRIEKEREPGTGVQTAGKEDVEEKESFERDGKLSVVIRDKLVGENESQSAQQSLGKAKGGGEGKEKKKKKKKMDGEVERAPELVVRADDDNQSSPKTKTVKKRARKRMREGDDMEDNTTEEGMVKKKRRNSKKKEETPIANTNSTTAGRAKKKRSKKKGEDEEDEDAKEPEVPKKAPTENLLGEIDEIEFRSKRRYPTQSVKSSSAKNAEGNFVKINLKKKSHVKGYALRGMALRKQMHMHKFQLKGERFGGGGYGRGRGGWGGRGGFRGGLSRQGDSCYKCGGTGHWAIDCKGPAPPPPGPDDKFAEEEPFELPTLEEVARATGTLQPQSLVAYPSVKEEQHQLEKGADSNKDDETLLNVIRPDYERPAAPPPMEPLYPLTDTGKVQDAPDEVHAALKDLGYQSFRPGQEEAIMRILSGLSTLVVLSTGMGKSLCYQLPAYLYAQRSKSITLVISPLVSLMDDQLSGVPAKLKAACIHSNMTMKQREAAIEKVKAGLACVLLLSPEALVGGGGSSAGCLPSAQELPPVAFACIDEAHCVSEWSHNFRPCYLRLCKVLRERLGVQCLLGLTATATLSTAMDIAQHLDITDEDGIAVRSAAVPPNLNLSVSTDKEKDQALVSLLKGDRFGCLDSIIIYCTRREQTGRVAALLRTCLQGVLLKENKQAGASSQMQSNPVAQKKKELARKKIRKPLKWQAESYHAGLSGSERRRVQNNFMCGELRIVVATVAFGMGLDKSDVRGIIHYNMPKSFENYVQEIGRAGRDGDPAHCHLFLDPQGEDLHELRRHIYGDTVDFYTVKRLVQKVFPACKCKQIHQKQQELWEDVEDAEMLEAVDVCDQESKFNCGSQQNVLHEPSDAQMSDPDSARQSSQEDGREDEEKKEEGERNGDVTVKDKEADCQKSPKVETYYWPKERVCHSHERAIPIEENMQGLDITEEGVETLLCYLELHPQRFVELLHPTLSVCKVSCYDGPKQLQKITKLCAPIAVVLARMRMAGEQVERCSQVEFDVVEVADTMGWQLPLVKRGLRQLQWSTDRGGRSGILVEFSSPSFYFRSCGDLSDEEMDRVCQFLNNRVQEQERTRLYQLTACFKAFKSVAFQNVTSCVDELDGSRSVKLKELLSEYFDKRRDKDLTLKPLQLEELDNYKLLDWETQIRSDIRSFLSTRSDEKFSGRAVARILHGIGSPCYPPQIYGRDRRYWRKYIQFDFNELIRLATQEIIRFK
ncbi:ATP-dependent DNA helicase Q4 [Cololabis saira]|uniref:ATP-dependent DNA helicase Q4 n=1 Tax=Cololabis saira TaxID=129043 RepID=UPI002AD203F0|nr:ATP-dependent DNA helicase Q4 [Cololabis saira]